MKLVQLVHLLVDELILKLVVWCPSHSRVITTIFLAVGTNMLFAFKGKLLLLITKQNADGSLLLYFLFLFKVLVECGTFGKKISFERRVEADLVGGLFS